MKKNIGNIDRLTRLLIAIATAVPVVTGLVADETRLILLCLSAIFFITSASGFCPVYNLLNSIASRSR